MQKDSSDGSMIISASVNLYFINSLNTIETIAILYTRFSEERNWKNWGTIFTKQKLTKPQLSGMGEYDRLW